MNKYISQKQDNKKLDYALAELFFGLSRANLTRSKNLGMARQKALEQIESFLKSKNPNNPTVKYLYQKYMENKSKWARAIMNSAKSADAIKLPPESQKKNEVLGAKWVNEALGKLNKKIKESEPRTNTYAHGQEVMKSKMGQAQKPEAGAVVVELHNAELSHEQTKKLIQMAMERIRQNAA